MTNSPAFPRATLSPAGAKPRGRTRRTLHLLHEEGSLEQGVGVEERGVAGGPQVQHLLLLGGRHTPREGNKKNNQVTERCEGGNVQTKGVAPNKPVSNPRSGQARS